MGNFLLSRYQKIFFQVYVIASVLTQFYKYQLYLLLFSRLSLFIFFIFMTYQELLDATSDYASSIQPKTARRDEQFLTRFLTVSKNDVSKAAERYRNYYSALKKFVRLLIFRILFGRKSKFSKLPARRSRLELRPFRFIGQF